MHGFNIIKNHELIAASQERKKLLTTLTNADSHYLLFSNCFLKKCKIRFLKILFFTNLMNFLKKLLDILAIVVGLLVKKYSSL